MSQNVTYIDDLLDLDDPNQRGAFNKVAAKESIKVLPPTGFMDNSSQNIEHFKNNSIYQNGTNNIFDDSPIEHNMPPSMQPPIQHMQPNIPSMQPNIPNMQPSMQPPMQPSMPIKQQINKSSGLDNPGMKGTPGKPDFSKPNPIKSKFETNFQHNDFVKKVPEKMSKFKPEHFKETAVNPKGFFKKIIKHRQENYQNSQHTCMDIAEHIAFCPICSKIYRKNDVPFIVVIVVLAILILFLGKRIFDLQTK